MLLLSVAVVAFLSGFVLGKFSPLSRLRKWNWHHTIQEGDWSYTVLFHESEKEVALAYQRNFADTYKAAKARGLIH
jgi:hypothetical protein